MKFQDKLKKLPRGEIWQSYCGFLDLSLEAYMDIQNRLMREQMDIWSGSGLGRALLGGRTPGSIQEFRQMLPLTSYEDYAEVLLSRREEMLPSKPVIWIQTTWEGGLRPVKLAPYSREMLDCYKHNVLAVTLLASGSSPANIPVARGDRILYGGAPLPYITGLLPSILDEDIRFQWLPDTNENSHLSFSQRIKKGFAMAFGGGLDFFFAIGSVANYITEHFGDASGGGGRKGLRVSPGVAYRWLRAKYICRRDGRKMVPGDVFRLKGMVCTGTDARCYRENLSRAWGVYPVEIAAGTESTCIAAESRQRPGMVFFPDACFYEFIPREEMERSLEDRGYRPRTCLMDEVRAGQEYELVISVLHGGAFMRYRIGDMYRCLSAGGSALPRFIYLDRVPTVIDIAGFTRITESTVTEVIRLSKLGIGDWFARKEFDGRGYPFLHMYAEIRPEAQDNDVTRVDVLRDLMSVYFKYYDSDYGDLKKLLDMEPLQITIIPWGSMETFRARTGRTIRPINPDALDVAELLANRAGTGQEGRKGAGPV